MHSILTTWKQKSPIALLTAVVLGSILSISCSTWVNSDWGDCGYSAYYKTEENGGKPEIVFSQITAETLGGHRNCGFQYIKTKVDRAEIDGIELPERAEPDKYAGNYYFYAANPGFDPRKTAITIHQNGKRYRSDLASVKQTGFNANVKLEPVWFW